MDLEAVAPILEQILKESLEEKRYRFGFARYTGLGDKVASGKLVNSVQVNVVQKRNESVLSVVMEDYGQFVQSGRIPGQKGVPISAIEQWIKDRKLQGRDRKGRYITRRSFAFAIQTNIKKFGIRPSNFLDVAFDKIMDDDRIIEIIGQEAFDDLINAIEGI
jgi:hypothetical protein